jgi:hypothetical protein
MTHTVRVVFLAAGVIATTHPAASQQAPAPSAQQPAPPSTPDTQVPPPAGVAVPLVPATPTAPVARTFTGGCGLLLHPVRPERVGDFENFLAYVREALAKSTNPRVRSQAAGWRFFKAAEAGPNGVALYVFLIDPAVPSADYALGPILAEVYTDPAQLNEIWALYLSSVTSGGTLLNFALVEVKAPPPILAAPVNPPAAGQTPAAPASAPAPAAAAPGAKPVTVATAKC